MPEHLPLQRRRSAERHSQDAKSSHASPTAPAVRSGTASGGQALDRHTQATMSARFGHDFSQVRIHTDARAEESASALGANAYAVGSDIVFGAGKYQPGSPSTERLLAHELTHVAQQAQLGGGDWGRISHKGDASEREADSLASQVMMGRSVQVQAAPGAAIARDRPDELGPLPQEPRDRTAEAGGSFYGDLLGLIPGVGTVMSGAAVSEDLDQANDPKLSDKAQSLGKTNAYLDGAGAIPGVGSVLSAGRAGWDFGSTMIRSAGGNPDYAPTSGEAFNDLVSLF